LFALLSGDSQHPTASNHMPSGQEIGREYQIANLKASKLLLGRRKEGLLELIQRGPKIRKKSEFVRKIRFSSPTHW